MIKDGKSVVSCLVLAVECEGSEIETVEGLAKEGILHSDTEGICRAWGDPVWVLYAWDGDECEGEA